MNKDISGVKKMQANRKGKRIKLKKLKNGKSRVINQKGAFGKQG